MSAVGQGKERRKRAALASLAPGTALRDGLERILRGSTGALIVLGYSQAVRELCSGGFELDAAFSATRLRELAKMDGAIVVDPAGQRIVRAAVQLLPDPALPADESGTRHRTAERVARQTGFPVITVSKSMRVIALYLDGDRYPLEDPAAVLSRAHQALATLERYRRRLSEATGALSALEIEDLATGRDVSTVTQRLEMIRRISCEIEGYLLELGTDGRLLALQLDELTAGTGRERALLVRDYVTADAAGLATAAEAALARLERLSPDELTEAAVVSGILGLGGADGLDDPVSPRGYRLVAKVPRVPQAAADALVQHFGGLQKLLGASAEDLQQVGGVDGAHARSVREGLSRLAESSLVERYA
ncbi:MAG TPA: DNA integrity scanning diadenylate cyclase DisA [Streptosporangiaceae bacterium]